MVFVLLSANKGHKQRILCQLSYYSKNLFLVFTSVCCFCRNVKCQSSSSKNYYRNPLIDKQHEEQPFHFSFLPPLSPSKPRVSAVADSPSELQVAVQRFPGPHPILRVNALWNPAVWDNMTGIQAWIAVPQWNQIKVLQDIKLRDPKVPFLGNMPRCLKSSGSQYLKGKTLDASWDLRVVIRVWRFAWDSFGGVGRLHSTYNIKYTKCAQVF